MKLSKVQKEKVDKIVNHYKIGNKNVSFQAPTGSGKTFMIANIISEISKYASFQDRNKKIIFIVMTISIAELPKAMCEKINEYKLYLNYDIGKVIHKKSASSEKFGVDEDATLSVEDANVIILGNSSFKKNTIYKQRGLDEDFLNELKREYEVIYIRDEAHYASSTPKDNPEEFEYFENQLENLSTFVLKMSATLNEFYENQVILSEEELMDDDVFLLKSKQENHYGLSKKEIQNLTEIEYFEEALKQFVKIKKEYKENGIPVNPAAIIQIKDRVKSNQPDFNKHLNEIKKIIDDNNLVYAIHFYDLKESNNNSVNASSLIELSKPNSIVDIIIIKVGPSIGWDIPRANTLIQLKKVHSENLTTQLVGRIRRNPIKDLSFNEITNKYYLYSSNEIKTKDVATYTLKQKFENDFFYRGEIVFSEKEIWNEVIKSKEMNEIIEKNNERIMELVSDYKNNNYIFHVEETFSERKDNEVINKGFYIDDYLSLNKFLNPILQENKSFYYLVNAYIDKEKLLVNKNEKLLYFYAVNYLYLNELKKLVGKKLLNEKFESKVINDTKIPKNYSIIKKEETTFVSFSSIDEIYAYINNNENEKELQYLDSKPENKFLTKVIDEIKNNLLENFEIDVLFKNPDKSNSLIFEYLDYDEGRKRKSFVDFVMKNGKKHFYAEVKSINDYDERKTELIERAFEMYSKDNPEIEIVFGLIWVKGEENNYELENSFYSTTQTSFKTLRKVIEFIMKK